MRERKLLLVVDMQNDFVTGVLGTPEARAIVPVIKEKIHEYEYNCDIIRYTMDTHVPKDYKKTQEGKVVPLHCVIGSVGHAIVDELGAPNGTLDKIIKEHFSANPQEMKAELWPYIENKDHPVTEIEVCGVCTDICVISNIVTIQALFPGVRITVDSKAVAGTTPEANEAALTVLRSLLVNVI